MQIHFILNVGLNLDKLHVDKKKEYDSGCSGSGSGKDL